MKSESTSLAQQPQATTHLLDGDGKNERPRCGSLFGRMVRFISNHKCETVACTGVALSVISGICRWTVPADSPQARNSLYGYAAGGALALTGVIAIWIRK